jgi:hypothetical protein
MSLDKARENLKQAMAHRSVYDAMAASENEVWGTILPALEDSQARLDDIATTEKLNANRHQSYLIGVAREKNLRFTNGLTLGCGAGRLERALVHEGICSTFHGIRPSLQRDRLPKKQSLPLIYEVADLNLVELPEKHSISWPPRPRFITSFFSNE